jgi:hypothetical protein
MNIQKMGFNVLTLETPHKLVFDIVKQTITKTERPVTSYKSILVCQIRNLLNISDGL